MRRFVGFVNTQQAFGIASSARMAFGALRTCQSWTTCECFREVLPRHDL